MNALQRAQLRQGREKRNASAPSENTIIAPIQCVACGEPLDGLHMDYCYDSDNGSHVRPSSN
jgi:hypothetical protein